MTLKDLKKFIQERSGLFVIAAIALVAFISVSTVWLLKPDYVVVSKESTEAAQADILATLAQWNIPYRIDTKEGAIEVKQEDLALARIHLAEAGIQNRNGVGFELFDHADYGMSEFSQKINYQRALEGELSRSIMTLREIKYARVHLTLKKPSFYQNAQEQPKASVIVHMRPNMVLNAQEVQGIQNLVASAVDGIQKEKVTVLDEEGRLLNVDEDGAPTDRMQASEKLELELQRKAEQLLQHSVGVSGAFVSVRVQMNFDHVKSVREQPLQREGNVVVREKQHSTSAESQDENEGKHSQSTREVEYAVGQERSETEYSVGRIERVSVGVALSSPLSDGGMDEMRNILSAALGLNEERGDRLEIAYIQAVVPNEQPLTNLHTDQKVEDDNVQATDTDAPPKFTKVWIGLTILLAIAFLWSIYDMRRMRTVGFKSAPMSHGEREQLLQDLRRWVQEER